MTASELEKHILLGEIERLTKELFRVGGSRKRQPLSEVAIAQIYIKWNDKPGTSYADYARAIEQAHGIGVGNE
jgi:hypothetical protein